MAAGNPPFSACGAVGVPPPESRTITVTRFSRITSSLASRITSPLASRFGELPTSMPSQLSMLVSSSHRSRRWTLLVPSIASFNPARTSQSATSAVLFVGSATMVPSSHASGSTGVAGTSTARAACCAASATIATARKTSQRLTRRLGSGGGRNAAGGRRRRPPPAQRRPRGTSHRAPPPADAPSPRGCGYGDARDGSVRLGPTRPPPPGYYTLAKAGAPILPGSPGPVGARMTPAPGRIDLWHKRGMDSCQSHRQDAAR